MTSAARAEAAAALLAALREVADANERLQVAAAWVLEAFGDQLDAETVRMLPVRGGPDRPGRPPVPVATPRFVTSDERCCCGHLLEDHGPDRCEVGACLCDGFDAEGVLDGLFTDDEELHP